MRAATHRRHHTWHHAPHKRAYDQTIWDIQRHNAAHGHRSSRSNWESDSESEMSEYSAPSVKRQASLAGSDCGSSDDLQSVGAGGPGNTWPRPNRKRGSEDAMNIWELTRSLAREKSDLADQLARLTAQSSRDASYQAKHLHSAYFCLFVHFHVCREKICRSSPLLTTRMTSLK